MPFYKLLPQPRVYRGLQGVPDAFPCYVYLEHFGSIWNIFSRKRNKDPMTYDELQPRLQRFSRTYAAAERIVNIRATLAQAVKRSPEVYEALYKQLDKDLTKPGL